MKFDEKILVILGGFGGLGTSICRELIRKGLKKLAIIDILNESDALKKIESLKDTIKDETFKTSEDIVCLFKNCSVVDRELLKKSMEEVKMEFGSIDIVINAAGIANELDPAKLIEINLTGTVNSTLIGIDLMRKDSDGNSKKGGTIINIASIAGLRPVFFMPIYSGTKHAIVGFTRSLTNNIFYERTGVNFIVICPGATRTPIIGHENVIDKFLFPEMLQQVRLISKKMKLQEPEIVAKCVIMAVEDNQNGTVWQCENSHIEKLEMYEYPEF